MLLHSKHKKLYSLVAVFVMAVAALSPCTAQNCDSLVRPKFASSPGIYEQLPPQKIQHYCLFAYNAFYWSDTLPQNAVVYDITDVSNKTTGQHIAQSKIINLNTFSYYAYNFDEFQYRNYYQFICFRVGAGNRARYLVLRDYNTIMKITLQLETNQ